MNTRTDYPECEKLAAVAPESQKIGEFMEWCEEQGYHFSMYDTKDNLMFLHKTKEQILADYFEIDMRKVEEERQAILRSIGS